MNAFVVYKKDNDSYAFRRDPKITEHQRTHQALVPDMSGETLPGVQRCLSCGELLNKWDAPLVELVVRKRKYDISTTYDSVAVASERFKAIYDANGLTGLVFQRLPRAPGFFGIQANRIVGFDAESSETRFLNQCDKCGHFESVVGVTPVFLKHGNRIQANEFARTDIEFGSNDEKGPLLLCGHEAARVLSEASVKGLELEPIASCP